MRPLLLFACKRGRPRDIPLLREGARAAGYRFVLVLVPFAYLVLPATALLRLIGVPVHLIVSDRFLGDAAIARLFGADAARMLWNYADEFPSMLHSAPAKRACFFEDGHHPVQLFRFAPQPGSHRLNPAARREALFVGDVTTQTRLPQGSEWWQQRLQELLQRHGYGFYLGEEYRRLLATSTDSMGQLREARVLTKNLLRLWIVEAARRHFGDRVVLVGSNWRQHGLEAAASAYSLSGRLELYTSATVLLDCGSKSGDSALYPRSSEIISYAGAPAQVVCADSGMVFGERVREITFADEASLVALIERRLGEAQADREERAAWLEQRLVQHRLTMADSLHRLFGQDAGARPALESAR